MDEIDCCFMKSNQCEEKYIKVVLTKYPLSEQLRAKGTAGQQPSAKISINIIHCDWIHSLDWRCIIYQHSANRLWSHIIGSFPMTWWSGIRIRYPGGACKIINISQSHHSAQARMRQNAADATAQAKTAVTPLLTHRRYPYSCAKWQPDCSPVLTCCGIFSRNHHHSQMMEELIGRYWIMEASITVHVSIHHKPCKYSWPWPQPSVSSVLIQCCHPITCTGGFIQFWHNPCMCPARHTKD